MHIHISSISQDDILQALKNLKPNSCAGLDGIPAFFIKDCSSVLIEPLYILFNKCIRTGKFPTIWKETRVCPILKGGDPSAIKNYRPISVLSNFGKLFESILYSYIYPLLKNAFNVNQHGFMAGRSTLTNLFSITQYLSQELDQNKQVDVAYTDMSKAFDSITHNRLFLKLRSFGFSESTLALFQSYLLDRKLRVVFNGYKSQYYTQFSGVPQGSNLGPLLFLIYIDDIAHIIKHSRFELYADDLKIYKTINTYDDSLLLQEDIHNIVAWCTLNGLTLNILKCLIVSFTRKHTQIIFNYVINEIIIARSKTVKDLGVIFDDTLSFREHITNVVQTTFKLLGFIIRNAKPFNNVSLLKSIYCSLVRSKLEYCSLIYFPFYNYQSLALESVQRRFLKFMFYQQHREYPILHIEETKLLEEFKLESLKQRRISHAIAFLHKVVHGVISSEHILSYVKFHVPRINSRYALDFILPKSRTNLMKKSPLYTICHYANNLPPECDIYADSLRNIMVKSRSRFSNYL